jgi:hypothetical protein
MSWNYSHEGAQIESHLPPSMAMRSNATLRTVFHATSASRKNKDGPVTNVRSARIRPGVVALSEGMHDNLRFRALRR